MAMDPASAMDPRYQDTFADLHQDIISGLRAELQANNPMAQAYATAGELLREYMAAHNNALPRYPLSS